MARSIQNLPMALAVAIAILCGSAYVDSFRPFELTVNGVSPEFARFIDALSVEMKYETGPDFVAAAREHQVLVEQLLQVLDGAESATLLNFTEVGVNASGPGIEQIRSALISVRADLAHMESQQDAIEGLHRAYYRISALKAETVENGVGRLTRSSKETKQTQLQVMEHFGAQLFRDVRTLEETTDGIASAEENARAFELSVRCCRSSRVASILLYSITGDASTTPKLASALDEYRSALRQAIQLNERNSDVFQSIDPSKAELTRFYVESMRFRLNYLNALARGDHILEDSPSAHNR